MGYLISSLKPTLLNDTALMFSPFDTELDVILNL